MAGLSSIIRTRCLSSSESFAIERLRPCEGQRQGEGGALAGSGTFGLQPSAQFLGRECAAVQSEAVTVLASGEAVTEDAFEVVLRDADARIDDGDEHRSLRRPDPDGYTLFAALRFIAGVFGVADDV